ncbi:hypothetical protein NQZ68_030186 [Dissostichus eleginoides]|nr:hypothetical protein NQZ68_030186 [Dissostichus eleginoides]
MSSPPPATRVLTHNTSVSALRFPCPQQILLKLLSPTNSLLRALPAATSRSQPGSDVSEPGEQNNTVLLFQHQ